MVMGKRLDINSNLPGEPAWLPTAPGIVISGCGEHEAENDEVAAPRVRRYKCRLHNKTLARLCCRAQLVIARLGQGWLGVFDAAGCKFSGDWVQGVRSR
jgi:hypothetical protein